MKNSFIFIGGLFLFGVGVTSLQVSANPLMPADEERARVEAIAVNAQCNTDHVELEAARARIKELEAAEARRQEYELPK